MKKNGSKKAMIMLLTIACVTLVSVSVAFAAYVNKVQTQTNTITIGQNTQTLVLGEGQADAGNPAELYPGDSVTFTYTVAIKGITGDVTVAAAVDQAADFTVAVTNADGAAFTDNKVADGNIVKVTVTMKDSITAVPAYNQITLTVTLTEAAAPTA